MSRPSITVDNIHWCSRLNVSYSNTQKIRGLNQRPTLTWTVFSPFSEDISPYTTNIRRVIHADDLQIHTSFHMKTATTFTGYPKDDKRLISH